MQVSKKNLIVLTDYDDFKVITPNLLVQCDFLAMTPSAMLACQERRLKYLSSDDFYHYREFRVDNLRLIQETEEFFFALDIKYKTFLNFPRVFKGNIYPFLRFFSDVHYISKVSRSISRQYEKVYLIGMPMEKDSFESELKFSLSALWLPILNVASRRGLDLFANSLTAQCVWLKFNKPEKRFKGINIYQVLYLIKRVYRKITAKFKLFSLKRKGSKKRIIFIIIDGYEAGLSKKYLQEFSYIDPITRLLQKIRNNNTEKLNLKPLFLNELKGFVRNWFPNFEKYVFEVFVSYHNEVLCFLNSFYKNLEEAFNYYHPSALFYSVGALSIYEDICGYIANQKNVPVFFFQHAGAATSAFSHHFFQRYIEHNENITKVNMFESKKEKENLSKNKDVSADGPALGSIKLYNMYLKRKKNILSRRKKKILYCPDPFPFYGYKDCMWNSFDKQLFEINQSVIETVHKFDLRMDIKVNRTYHEADDYAYFNKLIKNQKSTKSRVLTGFLAEAIINNYGLFLLDGILTAMLQMFIVLDVPVILYLQDTSLIYQEVIVDMRERFYFVEDKSDLEEYLNLFARGKLPSKFSLDFMDKYSFPIDKGDPGIHIANYIRKQLLRNL